MTRFGRFLLIAGVGAALFAVGAGMLVAYGFSRTNVVTVQMHQLLHGRYHTGSFDLDLPVPAVLVAAAADLAAITPRHDSCPRLAERRRHDWRPAVRAACRALAGARDGTLVQVESGPEKVQVVKRGDTVEVQILSPKGEIRVTTPAGLVWHLAGLV